MAQIMVLLCLSHTMSSQKPPTLTVNNEGTCLDNNSCRTEMKTAGCNFQKAKSPEWSISLWLFNMSVHIYNITCGSLQGFRKQSSHLWCVYIYIYISFPGLNVTSSLLFPCFFLPLSCLRDIVPNANSVGSHSKNAHRRWANSIEGPSGPNSWPSWPSFRFAYLKKVMVKKHTLFIASYY